MVLGHLLPRRENRLEPYASPIRATNLENLPKALVVTAEFDPLRDEGRSLCQSPGKLGSRRYLQML